jgi:hypothetical protein
MLCLGGFGALVYGAGPGDALYGLRVAVFGEQQVTRDDQVALAAQTEMQQVQKLIEQGNWDAAQDRLTTITSTVQTVEDPQRQRNLQQQLNDLTAKVETRDVNATAPPLPDASIVPNVSIPNPQGPISLPPLPQLPPSVPGIPLPDISLPQVPLPSIPQLPIPGSRPSTCRSRRSTCRSLRFRTHRRSSCRSRSSRRSRSNRRNRSSRRSRSSSPSLRINRSR